MSSIKNIFTATFIVISAILPFSANGFLFPSSSNSCCAASSCSCPMPSCPPVARCPQQVEPQIISCCSTCPCQKRKRNKRDTIEFLSNATYILDENFKKIHKRDVLDEVVHVDAKCNSESLREIIIQNIDRVTSVAKKRIQEEAESQLQGRYNVICARGDFSYVTNTESFCQQTVGDVTCYVFKQLSSVIRKRLA